MRKMVRCADHKDAPAGIVCVHLASGTATEWVSAATGPDSEYDCMCVDCAKHVERLTADDLLLMCMHCIRKVKAGVPEMKSPEK